MWQPSDSDMAKRVAEVVTTCGGKAKDAGTGAAAHNGHSPAFGGAGEVAGVLAQLWQQSGKLPQRDNLKVLAQATNIAASASAMASWIIAQSNLKQNDVFRCPVAPQLQCTGIDKCEPVKVKMEGASRPTVIPLQLLGKHRATPH